MADISMESNGDNSLVEQMMPQGTAVVSPSKLAEKVGLAEKETLPSDNILPSANQNGLDHVPVKNGCQQNGSDQASDCPKASPSSGPAVVQSEPQSSTTKLADIPLPSGSPPSPSSSSPVEICVGTPSSCPLPDPITPASTNGLSCSPGDSCSAGGGDQEESSFSISGLEESEDGSIMAPVAPGETPAATPDAGNDDGKDGQNNSVVPPGASTAHPIEGEESAADSPTASNGLLPPDGRTLVVSMERLSLEKEHKQQQLPISVEEAGATDDYCAESAGSSQATSGPSVVPVAEQNGNGELGVLSSAKSDAVRPASSTGRAAAGGVSDVAPQTSNGAAASLPDSQPDKSSPTKGQSSSPVKEATTADSQIYHIKWVHWHGTKTPIVTQNENGPCPLIAVINVLLLRGQISLAENAEIVSGQQLFTLLGDCILRLQPSESLSEEMKKDYERNVSDAINNLNKLQTGIDVNVRFTGVKDFEYTDDCLLFDILNLTLCHGWLVEPEDAQTRELVGTLSYNQLAERVIQMEQSADQVDKEKVECLTNFLRTTASQLTYHGISELHSQLKDNEMAVFFRNNHFSVLLKSKDELFLLVTDQGFLGEPRVVWETLHTVDGDSHFVDAELKTIPPRQEHPVVVANAPLAEGISPEQQMDHDLAVALSLEEREVVEPTGPPETTGDFQLAKQLQAEEDQASSEQQTGASSGNEGRPAAGGSSQSNGSNDPGAPEPRKKSCTLL